MAQDLTVEEAHPVDSPFVFIVGSPRSGTTILGEVLDHHPAVAQWYEPYFVWDRHFRLASDDQRDADDATPLVADGIRSAFAGYRRARGAEIVVDKSPRNCLKIPFVRAIFPEARFIFLLRDGRDTILSIHREWLKRRKILLDPEGGRRWRDVGGVVRSWLKRQPLWTHRLEAALFEMGSPRDWLRGRFLHRSRWGGRIGWGPRFRGWEALIDRLPLLAFNAVQWSRCVEPMLSHWGSIPADRLFVMRYEQFTEDPSGVLGEIFGFLRLDIPRGFMERIPKIRSGNSSKWKVAFGAEDLQLIEPVIAEPMRRLGYDPSATSLPAAP
jgi:hypothetical protein